jgi:AcrR family transcriptional regulator
MVYSIKERALDFPIGKGKLKMARTRDENKRTAILQASMMLFSQKGFFNTSISDIVKVTGLSVGTIYTYFQSKDEIVRAIVEEGWSALYARLKESLSSSDSPEAKLRLLIGSFIPEISKDMQLITILLSEAIPYTRIEEKVEALTDMVFSAVRPLLGAKSSQAGFTRETLRTSLVVIFLGIMNTLKIARSSSIGISEKDVIKFVTVMAENSLGLISH